MYSFLIIGGGNLGFRYAEGILKLSKKFKLTIVEKSNSRLVFLKQNLSSIIGYDNNIIELTSEISKSREFDLAILATNSDVRFKLFDEYDRKHHIRNWILEKVLSSSIFELALFPRRNNIWVNTFLRRLELFSKIKALVAKSEVLIQVSGGNWGLACNSIHYIDLVSWMFDSMPTSIDNSNLENYWFTSKREEFFEINGVLNVSYPNNVKLIIECANSNDDLTISIEDNNNTFLYNLISGSYQLNSIKTNIVPVPYQSDMTKDIVNEILEYNNSSLAPIGESIHMHELLISVLKNNWDLSNLKGEKFKIT